MHVDDHYHRHHHEIITISIVTRIGITILIRIVITLLMKTIVVIARGRRILVTIVILVM